MKNINIFTRTILERKQRGFFSEKSETEVKTDLTEKQANELLEAMNKGKRVLFTLFRYDLTTNYGRANLIQFLLSGHIVIKRSKDLSELRDRLLTFYEGK